MFSDQQPFLTLPQSHLANRIATNIANISQNKTDLKITKPTLFEVESIISYQNAHKLRMGTQKINKIAEQLSLLLQTEQAYLQRIKRNHTYLHYTFNPFSLQQNSPTKTPQTHRKRQVLIMEGVEETRASATMAALEDRISRVEFNYRARHGKIYNQSQQAARNPSARYSADVHTQKIQKDRIGSGLQFLDRILNRKDEVQFRLNFRRGQLNIFNFIKGKYSKNIANCRQTLSNLHFCQNSIMHNPENKQGLMTFRQMSVVARQFITEKHNLISDEYRILSAEMLFKLDRLEFEQIMLVGSGILECEELAESLNRNHEVTSKDSQAISHYKKDSSRQQVQYQTNQRHARSLFQHQRFDHFLQQNLKQIPLNKDEQGQLTLSKELQQRMNLLLAKERILIKNFINDRQTKYSINKQKIQIMNQQILNDANTSRHKNRKNPIDVDRKIRLSKLHKDRSQKIKNKFIQMTLVSCKRQQRQIKAVLQKRKKKKKSNNAFSASKSVDQYDDSRYYGNRKRRIKSVDEPDRNQSNSPKVLRQRTRNMSQNKLKPPFKI